MSFVTRCPACATHFRVVADQLKIADGWVRCGQCGEVFDAAAQLLAPVDGGVQQTPSAQEAPRSVAALAQPESLPQPQPAPMPMVDGPSDARLDGLPLPAHSPQVELTHWPDEAVTDLPEPPQPPTAPWLDEPPVLPPEPPFPSEPLGSPVATEPAQPSTLHAGVDPVIDPATDPVLNVSANDSLADTSPPAVPIPLDRYEVPPAAELLPPPASEPDAGPALADAGDLAAVPEQVGFVRQAQRRAWWRRPAVRWALALLSLLLLLALAAQWVLHERDRIAALRPDLRPALERLCVPLGCTVQLLRWVDALNIESTTLARRGNGRYLLEVVVRNASLYALAMPALELSLTDVQDKLLLRRVIRPDELPGAPATVAAQETLTLRVEVLLEPAVSEGLSGYRTLLFYP